MIGLLAIDWYATNLLKERHAEADQVRAACLPTVPPLYASLTREVLGRPVVRQEMQGGSA